MAAKYFRISTGMRGMYMPDNSYTIRVFTRKALKEHLQAEADHFAEAGYVGASKAMVARLAQAAWHATDSVYPSVMPLKGAYSESYSHGIFVTPATLAEWKEDADGVDAL